MTVVVTDVVAEVVTVVRIQSLNNPSWCARTAAFSIWIVLSQLAGATNRFCVPLQMSEPWCLPIVNALTTEFKLPTDAAQDCAFVLPSAEIPSTSPRDIRRFLTTMSKLLESRPQLRRVSAIWIL